VTTNEKFDRPTRERLRRAEGEYERIVTDIDEDGRKTPVETLRMLDGSLLDRLARRGSIDGEQYHAGARFYGDWYFAGLSASGVLDPTRDIVDGGGPPPESERRMAAKTRYHRAIKAMSTRHGMVMQCCVLAEETLMSFGCRIHRLRDPKRGAAAALITLKDALSALDEHYNGRRTSGMVSAHEEGYRPIEVMVGKRQA
jgi:hypothetical protein